MAESRNQPVHGPSGPLAYGAGLGTDNTSGNATNDAKFDEGVIFPSQVSAVALTSQEFINAGARGLRLFITNAATAGATLVVKVQVRMHGTTTWIDLPAGAATVTTTALGAVTGAIWTVYPGLTGIADAAAAFNQHLGVCWRLVATPSASTTFSVSAEYLM